MFFAFVYSIPMETLTAWVFNTLMIDNAILALYLVYKIGKKLEWWGEG